MPDVKTNKTAVRREYYYFINENGRVRMASSRRERKKQRPEYIVKYDKAFLYHLYCMSGGKVSEMWKNVEQLPAESRRNMPSEKTIYRISKREGWPKRYAEFQSMLKSRMESEDSLTYERMNKAAGYVISLFMMRTELGGTLAIRSARAMTVGISLSGGTHSFTIPIRSASFPSK